MNAILPAASRTAQKSETRARLLRVASELFARQGVTTVTVDQIARLADTSRANFYLHFSGKADLLHAMRRHMWHVAQDFYDAFAALPDTREATLLRWLRKITRAWEREAELTRVVLGETPAEIRAEYGEHLQGYIDALIRDPAKWPGLSRDEAARRAYLLIIQLSGFLSDLHILDIPMDREAMLRSFATVWATALQPSSAP